MYVSFSSRREQRKRAHRAPLWRGFRTSCPVRRDNITAADLCAKALKRTPSVAPGRVVMSLLLFFVGTSLHCRSRDRARSASVVQSPKILLGRTLKLTGARDRLARVSSRSRKVEGRRRREERHAAQTKAPLVRRIRRVRERFFEESRVVRYIIILYNI